MQVVINISDSFYHRLIDMNIDNDTCSFNESALVEAIQNGTPLPKGHGRLGDLDELEQRISNFVEHDAHITDEYTVTRQRFIVDGIRQTVAIINADKEVKNENRKLTD